MKIRIKQCTGDTWYKNLVGTTFAVIHVGETGYAVKKASRGHYYVYFDDVEVTPDEPPVEDQALTRAEMLVIAHWKYIKGLLEAHGQEPHIIELIEFHYKSSGIHFYKHGREDVLAGE